jgi:hypothetical protein
MEVEQVAVPIEADAVAQDSKLRGVRGWLLFFCVTLVFLNPLATLGVFGLSLSQLAPLFNRFPGLLTLAAVDGIVSLVLMSLSVYAGVSLWRARPGAVKSARMFLIAGVVYLLVSPLFTLLAGLPEGAALAALPDAYLAVGRALLYYAIWLNYLNTSKRVKATYPLQNPA